MKRILKLAVYGIAAITGTKSLRALAASGKDALNIFRYYMDNINDGRAYILACFSQGAMMVRAILGTLTDDEYRNMKAACMIGMGLTDSPKPRK